jgi:hypothetical protein
MKPLHLLLGRTSPNSLITSRFLAFPDNCGASVFHTRSSKTWYTSNAVPFTLLSKGKSIPRQAELALGVPCRLRLRIFSTFGTTRVVDRQPNALTAFTPEEIPGTHFQRPSRPQDTWFCRKEPRKKSQVTPAVIDLGTARLVAQRLNHYATPGPITLLHSVSIVASLIL